MAETAAGNTKARIVLVEDHPAMREGFAQLLNFEGDLQVCGQASTANEALAIIAATRPDLAIVDISLAGTSGLDLIKNLGSLYPALASLVLSTHDEALYAERALRAGAKGYVMKQQPTEEVLGAIRKVLRGGVYLSESMHERLTARVATGKPAGPVSELDQLSDRELEVFRLLGEGLSTRGIAERLHLGISTVGTYRVNIKEKLGLANGTELVQRATAWVQAERARS